MMPENETERKGSVNVPRPYQIEILRGALKRNTIVYLPPSTGKTFVAVMLIKFMITEPLKKILDGGKRTFFLLDTPILLEQRKKYIRKYTRLSVGPDLGDDVALPTWRQDRWREALDKYQVMVVTAKILADILKCDYIHLRDINLIIIEECHAGIHRKKSMNQIMKIYERCSVNERPRIVGLTASLLNTEVSIHRLRKVVSKLERKLMCSLATISDISDIERISVSPNEKHVSYDNPAQFNYLEDIRIRIKYISDFVIGYGCNEAVNDPPFFNESILYKDIELSRKLAKKLADVWYNMENLGLYGGNIAALKLMMYIQRHGAKSTNSNEASVYMTFLKLVIMFRNIVTQKMNNKSEGDMIHEYSTSQVTTLFDIIKEYLVENDRCIIFVERRTTAEVLYQILKTASGNADTMSFMRPDLVVGMRFDCESTVPLKYECDIPNKLYTKAGKWNILQKFKKGETNVLITTDIVNDGLDAPGCKLVVRFDLPKYYRTYILSKAWGSKDNSYYVLLTPREEQRQVWNKMIQYRSIENDLKSILCDEYAK